jgi:heme O synthase-like polyprenyltransferase
MVLPKGIARVPVVILETLLPLTALIAISLVQPSTHRTLNVNLAATALLGSGFLYFGWAFAFKRSRLAARQLLTASILYLPLLYGLSGVFCSRAR